MKFACRIFILLSLLATGVRAGESGSFPELRWSEDDRVSAPLTIFPAPADPDVVFVTSDQGLWRTRDNAATWELIPQTGPGTLGTVSCLAVCPAKPECVILGSLDKGVFLSRDGGTTWTPAGGTGAGLSGASVSFVTFSKEDRGWQTLLACHGNKHPGLSKSIDGGQTWRVVSPRRYFGRLASFGGTLASVSSTLDVPDNWSLMFSQNYGENWRLVREGVDGIAVCETLGVRFNRNRRTRWMDDVLWGVDRGRLLVSQDCSDEYKEVGPVRPGHWASVFTTPSARPGQEWLWAYDPYRWGLVGAMEAGYQDEWSPNNRDLPVMEMIKRGANVAANAQGTKFYGCINQILYVGMQATNQTGPVILSSKVTPAARILPPTGTNAQYRFHVTARLAHAKGPGAVTAVSVTPSIFGLDAVDLYDDGKHDDGQAKDGVWGGDFSPASIPTVDATRTIRRRAFPGIMGIPITAVDTNGYSASWTTMVGVFPEAEPLRLWDGKSRWGHLVVPLHEGRVDCSVTGKDENASSGVRVQGAQGPWTLCWGTVDWGHDVTGLKYVVFEFRGSPGAGDVSFCLLDLVPGGGGGAIEPNYQSRFIPLLKSGCLPAMDGQYHVVRIPLLNLTTGIRFMNACVAGFGLRAGKDSSGGTYDFGQIWVEGDVPLPLPDRARFKGR